MGTMDSNTDIHTTRELSLESIHSAMQSKCYPDRPSGFIWNEAGRSGDETTR